MAHKPPLPDDVDLPDEVNGWRHDADSNRNGHVWRATSAQRSVAIFSGVADTVRVCVFDDRVSGFCNKIQPYDREFEDDETKAEATAWGVEKAVAWMRLNDPDSWDHPHVDESVFHPPAGFVLDRYYLEQREHILYYRQQGTESEVNMSGRHHSDTEPSLDTRKYLYIRVWRGSGNATVALAPWLRAHEHELHEVVDPPAECGLSVALKLAREWVAQQTGETRDRPAAGQSDLGAF